MAQLFSPLRIRDLELKNRIFFSPMCQYSSVDGVVDDWHLVHLGARAVGGVGLVLAEGTAVSPEGRITHGDAGLWSESHADAYRRITRFVKAQGVRIGVQLAHAGRKASLRLPWRGSAPLTPAEGAWETVGPSALAYGKSPPPRAATRADLDKIVADFVRSTELAVVADFDVIELHFAHGYLAGSFLSPASNQRDDEYGGRDLLDRARLPLEIVRAVRSRWPEGRPLFVKLSVTDWLEGGWNVDQSVQLAVWLKELGVDFVSCSSGGALPNAVIPAAPGFQVPFAEALKKGAGVLTGAVGLITSPIQAEQILVNGQADAILLARELMRNPYWPFQAARELDGEVDWPIQYETARF